MLLNLGFDISLNFGLLSNWDIRWLMILYGLAMFVWVLVLSGISNKSVYVALIALDTVVILNGIWPSIQMAGTGQEFWTMTSTSMVHVWLGSIAVVAWSTVLKSTIGAKLQGKVSDFLRNPRKRFVAPIGAWATTIVGFYYLTPFIPPWLVEQRFMIGAQLLVWGWVAFELPQYLMYNRMKRQYP